MELGGYGVGLTSYEWNWRWTRAETSGTGLFKTGVHHPRVGLDEVEHKYMGLDGYGVGLTSLE